VNNIKVFLNYCINFIKRNVINLITLTFLLLCIFYKPNCNIEAPGGLINISDRLSNVVYKSDGSFNLTYVTSYRGNIVTMLLGKILPDWDIVKDSEVSDIDYTTLVKMQTINLYSSISNATYNAYKSAGVDVNIKNRYQYIYYIYDSIADTNLEIGDKILKYDDKEMENSIEFKKYILSKNEGDTINFKVLRGKKEVDAYAKVKVQEDIKVIGVMVYTIYDYENDPDIHYAYQESEVGSSGGLMLSLSIYNSLVEEDITKGKKISGTGTIDMEGNVGEIAGIKYKILGAVKDKADVFIVPANNYEEAEKIVKKRKLKIKLIKAENFKQVLEELSNL
jgi:PDZ domain-containing protein